MPLTEKKFVASNGHILNYFTSEEVGSKRAHIFWFSAFTRGPLLGRILKTEQKFHGFRAASSFEDYSFTLIRDDSGLTGDGTYYFGKANNPFIEDAIVELITYLQNEIQQSAPETRFIGVGSSMGAYAATKFGILTSFSSVLAMVPHFDISAAVKYCGRKQWVDWACDDASPEEIERYLQRLQSVVSECAGQLPRLFVQSSIDDVGVHTEQVLPFVALYAEKGGNVDCDFRTNGGHSMVNASNQFIRATLDLLSENNGFAPGMFDSFPKRKELRTEKLERHFAVFENKVAKVLGR